VAAIALEQVWKVYADGTPAVRGVDLEVADGEFMVFVGPSGCGKTTALRMVAGLEDVSSGTIRIDGRVVNDVPSRDRDVAMVFQNYALYPHLSVADNIGFGLRLRKVDKREVDRRVRHAAEVLGIEELLDRRPRALSGGQRQRVAMGRAIVREPAAFLMDEPLSNLDAKLRVQTRTEILRLQKDLGVTTLYVTHDQVEAMTMGDRVAVMRKGIVQQVDTPQQLYAHPRNVFVAGFIGSPAMNFLRVRVTSAGTDGAVIEFGDYRLPLAPAVVSSLDGFDRLVGRDLVMGVRPEDFEDVLVMGRRAGEDRDLPTLAVVADLVERLGAEILVHFTLQVAPVLTDETRELAEDVSADLPIADHPHSEYVARVSPRSAVAAGETITLMVDVRRAHFFDPDSGLATIADPAAGLVTRGAPS
jgi:multiple sugar transport system ATP-binding protein